MDPRILKALASDRVIDITTTGRQTGQARRIEIWFHRIDNRVYITGRPGPRSWYANMRANPDFTFHLKQSIEVDLAARARPILDEVERRQTLAAITSKVAPDVDLEEWISGSPLVEVTFH